MEHIPADSTGGSRVGISLAHRITILPYSSHITMLSRDVLIQTYLFVKSRGCQKNVTTPTSRFYLEQLVTPTMNAGEKTLELSNLVLSVGLAACTTYP